MSGGRRGARHGLCVAVAGLVLGVASESAARVNLIVIDGSINPASDKATDLDRTTGYAFEIEAYNRTVGTEDRQEGINAFNEKRKPKYEGR